MNFIVLFCWTEGLGMVCNWMPMIESIWLLKDCACHEVTGVSDQPEGSGVIWKCKDRRSDKGLIRVWKDVSWGEAQMNGTSFLVRLNKACVISKTFLINRL